MANLTWEEKKQKAEETARKSAEKKGLDEAATLDLVKEAVSKVEAAQHEAEQKAEQMKAAQEKLEDTIPTYVVTVIGNPNYCGVGAGGVQFAYGKAETDSERMAQWFREHTGYRVEKK